VRPQRLPIDVFLALALAGCGIAPTASPSLSLEKACPLLTPTVIPSGFVPVERHAVNSGGDWFGDITVYRHASGASLAFASGSPSEKGGVGTGERVQIRGHRAEIFHQPSLDQFSVTWLEATPDKPCHQYSISAEGLELADLVEVIGGVK
jgi:hypothetical protein